MRRQGKTHRPSHSTYWNPSSSTISLTDLSFFAPLYAAFVPEYPPPATGRPSRTSGIGTGRAVLTCLMALGFAGQPRRSAVFALRAALFWWRWDAALPPWQTTGAGCGTWAGHMAGLSFSDGSVGPCGGSSSLSSPWPLLSTASARARRGDMSREALLHRMSIGVAGGTYGKKVRPERVCWAWLSGVGHSGSVSLTSRARRTQAPGDIAGGIVSEFVSTASSRISCRT